MLLKNCRLIPELTEGYSGTMADILIENGNIAAIGSCGTIAAEGETLDAAGKTVLPGLFDLHAHLMLVNADFYGLLMKDSNAAMVDCIRFAKNYLKYGYTTVRDCGGPSYTNIAVRDAIRDGVISGPDVISCGLILTPTAKGNGTFSNIYDEIDDPKDLMHAVRRDICHGADFIKYMATGSVANLGGEPGELVATPEELRAVSDAASFCNTYVAAHCHGLEGIKQCIRNGIYTIEHATYIDDECIDMILHQERQSALVPTFACMYERYMNFDEVRDADNEISVQCHAAFVAAREGIRKASQAGVLVGWGTDQTMQEMLEMPGREFVAREHMGLSNVELLKQATINSAKIVKQDDRKGTVKVGKAADLIVIDGDPVADISVMNQEPLHVLKNGVKVTV